jgi:hypothetical protein
MYILIIYNNTSFTSHDFVFHVRREAYVSNNTAYKKCSKVSDDDDLLSPQTLTVTRIQTLNADPPPGRGHTVA